MVVSNVPSLGESEMTSSSANLTKSPLDAAQKIVSELTGMTADQQALAVKFAIETLGLEPPASLVPPAKPSVQVTTRPTAQTPSSLAHSADIRAFTEIKAPKSDQQFTAIVAYFYQFEAKPDQRKETIDADTMKEAARLAGRPQVQRWNMTLTNAKNAGYLDAVGNGQYKLSSVGENLVAITLPGNGGSGSEKRSTVAKRSKPRRKKVTAVKKPSAKKR